MKVDTNKLNEYFDETATRLVSRKSMNKKELTCLIDSFNDKENASQLQPVTYENIKLRSVPKWYEMIVWRS